MKNYIPSTLIFVFLMGCSLPAKRTPADTAKCGPEYVQSELNGKAFCIGIQRLENVKAHEASDKCTDKKASLCSLEQWQAACKAGHISIGGWEWVRSLNQYTSIAGNNSCDDIGFGEMAHHAQLRCCISL